MHHTVYKVNRQFPLKSKQRQNFRANDHCMISWLWRVVFFEAICTNMPSSKTIRLCPEFYRSTKKKHQSCCMKNRAVREDLESSKIASPNPYKIELQTKAPKRSSSKGTPQFTRRTSRKIYKTFHARRSAQDSESSQPEVAKNNCYIKAIPDELLLNIFSYVKEMDLCHLAQVCTHFATICQDGTLWKNLYEKVFEMKRILMQTPKGFYDQADATSDQCWKESFRSLYSARHVHPKIAKERRAKCGDFRGTNIHYHESIQDAVKASSSGDMIIVHSGVYDEQLYIDKPLIIIGTADGERNHVTIRSYHLTVLRFGPGSSGAFLGHFNIKHCPNTQSQFSKEGCVEILGGCSPTVYKCHMISLSNAGATLYVHGQGAKPRVNKCYIRDSENVGLFVTDEAQGIYEECEITNTKLAGVWVKSRANPVMRQSTVHHGRDVGFFVFDSGMGYYDGIDVHSNRIAGFEIRSGANPVVVRCSIHHGLTGGIYCHDDARGEFLENRIFSNTYAGVWITSQSNPTIKNNEIFDGQQGGVYIFGEGRGLIESNDIHDNALAGIQIRTKSNPIVRCNKIHGGQHGGIYVHEGGMGLIEKNEIYGNTLAGIWITTGSAPNLRLNRIHSGKQVGVYFYDGGCGTLEENEIFHHKYSGIQIRSGSNPTIRKNKIWGGQNGGVLVYNEGLGLLEDNEIFDNAMAGVWIKTDSNPVLRGNRIHDGQEGGVCIFNGGKGVLEDNDIFRNSLTGVLISTFSFPVMRNNRIFDGGAAGVEITNNAGGVLEGNEIFNNRFEGICLATGVKPELKNNRLHGNKGLVERAVEAGQCLYQVSGNSCYPMHDFYRCATCNTSDGYAICVSCINTCHVGHDVEFVRHDRFFCDCGAGSTGVQCKLNSENQRPAVLCASVHQGGNSSCSHQQEHAQEIES